MSSELDTRFRPQYLLYSAGFGNYCTREGSGPLAEATCFTGVQQAYADAHKECFAPDARWLASVDMAKLAAVVAYVDAAGNRYMATWTGKTKRVWAQFPEGKLPPMGDMREVMIAAYEPTDDPVPAGLIACTCFVSDEPVKQAPPQETHDMCLGCPQYRQHSALRARNPLNCRNWLLAGASRCPNKAALQAEERARGKYIVIDEHTLCYWIDGWTNAVGILSGSVLRGGYNSMQGWTTIVPGHTKVRSATKEDFAEYRVCVPPDFDSK